jgi:hypothetical protein
MPSFLVMDDQKEVCPLSRRVMSQPNIQTITAWRLLSPSSSTHITIAILCSVATLSGAIWAYRVPHA